MSFTPKTWQNLPSLATRINSAALIDLETRLSDYTDTVGATKDASGAAAAVGGLLATAGVGVIVHGANANVARGTDFDIYIWIGSVSPNNIGVNDFYKNTGGNPDEPGIIVTPDKMVNQVATNAQTASQTAYTRFRNDRNWTPTTMGFHIGTVATANDSFDLGLMDNAGTRLFHSGATAGVLNGTTGLKTVSYTGRALVEGEYLYTAFAYGTAGGTAAKLVQWSWGLSAWAAVFGNTPGTAIAGTENQATVPSSMNATLFTTAGNPIVYLAP